MNSPDTVRSLELPDTGTETGGCGCGGCGCGSTERSPSETNVEESRTNAGQTTQSFAVTGMTCGHCASAVQSELKTVSGVTDVQVELVAGGTSTVTVTSEAPLEEPQVAAALDEAGDYRLA
jgi:copper chaperone CopZ